MKRQHELDRLVQERGKNEARFLELESSMRKAALKVANKLIEANLNKKTSDYHRQPCRCSFGGWQSIEGSDGEF